MLPLLAPCAMLLPLLSALALPAAAANAPLTFDNAGTVIYEAALFNTSATSVRGVLTGKAGPNHMGIRFHLRFWGLPDDEYIQYRIHTGPPVYDADDCAATQLFDPYRANATNNCDPRNPATWAACAAGDLAGKHGPLPHEKYMTEYLDDYLSINTANPAFFGDKLLVVAGANGTILNCGRFRLLEGSGVPVTVPFVWPSSLKELLPTAAAEAAASAANATRTFHLLPGTVIRAATPLPICGGRAPAPPFPLITGPASAQVQPCAPYATGAAATVAPSKHAPASAAAKLFTDSATSTVHLATLLTPTQDEVEVASPEPTHLRYPLFKHNSDSHRFGGGGDAGDGGANAMAGAHAGLHANDRAASGGAKSVVGVLQMALVGAVFILFC